MNNDISDENTYSKSPDYNYGGTAQKINWALNLNLPPFQKLFLIMTCSNMGGIGAINLNKNKIAKECGIDPRVISNVFKQLIKSGAITKDSHISGEYLHIEPNFIGFR